MATPKNQLSIIASPVDTFVRPTRDTGFVAPVQPGDVIQAPTPGKVVTPVFPGDVVREGRTPDPVRPGQLPPLPYIDQRSETAEALKRFSMTLSTFSARRRKKREEAEAQRGMQEFMRNRPQGDERGRMLQGKSDAYRKGFATAAARYDAMGDTASLRATIETQPGKFTTQEQVDAAIADRLDEALNDVEDDDYLNSYLNQFDKGEQQLRSVFERRRRQAEINASQENLYGSIANDMEQLGQQEDLNLDQVTKQLDQYYKLGMDLGLTRQQINEIAVQATITSAKKTRRPELLDVFDQPKPDGTPGLAKSKEDLGVSRFRAMQKAGALVAEGQLTQAWLEQRVSENLLTPTQAKNYMKAQQDRVVQMDREQGIFNMIASGQYQRIMGELSPNERRQYFNKYAKQKLERAHRGELSLDQVRTEVLLQGLNIGEVYEPWQHDLTLSTPGTGKRFQASAQLYKWIEGHPNGRAYLEQNMTDERSAVYDVYFSMLEATNKVEDAVQAARMATDPDRLAPARAKVSRNYRDLEEEARDAMDLDGVTNSSGIIDDVRNLMTIRLAMGNTSITEARDWAVKRIESSRMTMRTPSGKKIMVWTGGRSLPAGMKSAMSWFARSLQNELQATDQYDPEGYYAAPPFNDPTSDTWQVYRATDNWPVAGKKVNIAQMMQGYRESREEETDESVMSGFIKRQKERMQGIAVGGGPGPMNTGLSSSTLERLK